MVLTVNAVTVRPKVRRLRLSHRGGSPKHVVIGFSTNDVCKARSLQEFSVFCIIQKNLMPGQ
ncbi:MAG: hypothetical protein ACJ0K4_02430 [Verrucomicrobiales bacterium]